MDFGMVVYQVLVLLLLASCYSMLRGWRLDAHPSNQTIEVICYTFRGRVGTDTN